MAEHYWYKDLFFRTSEMIQIISLEGDIVSVNPAWLEMMEYTLEEVVGRSIYEFVDPKKAAAYTEFRNQVLLDKKYDKIFTTFITKTGRTIHISGTMEYISNQDRHYTRAILRRDSELAYDTAQSELNKKRLETIYLHAPDAIITINDEHQIIEWNKKAVEMFGYKEEEVKGRRIQDIIIPSEYRQAHEKGMAHFLKTGKGPVLNKTIEVPALKADGSKIFVALTISQVRTNDRWMFIAFLSDITDKKNLEQQNRDHEIELQVERTINIEKDSFLSIASHELKTPLTSLQLLIQLSQTALANNDYEKASYYLSKTNKHTININKMIDDLLNIGRISDDRLAMSFSNFDLNELLNELVSNCKLIDTTHHYVYEGAGPMLIFADAVKLEQVLQNVLNNAIRYSPAGTTITISGTITGSGTVEVSVADEGNCINETEKEKIFERFYRGSNSENHNQGLGIGLFISKEIIDRHGGKIWVENNAGIGCVFKLSIPARMA